MIIGFLGSYLYIGVSCDIQERKEKKSVFDFLSLILLLWYLYPNTNSKGRKNFLNYYFVLKKY